VAEDHLGSEQDEAYDDRSEIHVAGDDRSLVSRASSANLNGTGRDAVATSAEAEVEGEMQRAEVDGISGNNGHAG